MHCPNCGKKNPEGARFCMHCGSDLSGYKVEISPNIDVSPKIEAKFPSKEKEKCAICGKRDAVVYCKECGRKICNYHFEDLCPHVEERWDMFRGQVEKIKWSGLCTKCCLVRTIAFYTKCKYYEKAHGYSSDLKTLIEILEEKIEEFKQKLP